MCKKFWIAIILFLSCFAFGQSEAKVVKKYSEIDGVRYLFINSISTDDDNFIWFSGDDEDELQLNNQNKTLVIQRLNYNSIHTINLPESAQEGKILEILKMKDGKFLINVEIQSDKCLYYPFNPITCQFSPPLSPNNRAAHMRLSTMVQHNDQMLLLGQKNKELTLYALNDKYEFTPLFSFHGGDHIFKISKNTVIIPWDDYCIISDRNMPIYIFDWDGNNVKTFYKKDFNYPAESREGKHPLIDEFFVHNGDHYFFLNRNPQLYALDKITLAINPVEDAVLKTENFEIIQDPFGNTMIISNDQGNLCFYQFDGDRIVAIFKPIPHDEGKLSTTYSTNLKNGVWVSFKQGKLQYISFPKKRIKTYLPNASIRSILQEKDGTFSIITDNAGWYNLNLETDSLVPYTLRANGIEIDLDWNSNVIRNGNFLWVNSNTALKRINWLDKTVTNPSRYFPALSLAQKDDSTLIYGTKAYQLVAYNMNSDKHTALLNTDTLQIIDLEIDNQIVIAATDKGLLTYNCADGSHSLFQKSASMPDNFIISITKHPTYHYLLGTKQGFLYAFNPKTEVCNIIYQDNRKAAIATVLAGDNDDLWVNTFNGIVQFNPITQTSQRFSTADGLIHNEANRFSALKTENGMFVGTISGLNYFNPVDLKVKKDTSELILLSITKFNSHTQAYEQLLNREMFDSNYTIELDAEHRSFSIDFGQKNGFIEAEYRYEYQLNNEPWVNLNREQSIHFPNLEPGNYQLEIRAKNFANQKQGESLFLKIVANNFFYKTSWFYALIGLAILLFLAVYIRNQQKKRKIQEQFSRDLITTQEKERNRIAKELHDSIGQQLSLIKRKSQNDSQFEISALTDTTLEEVRSISRNLYPALLKEIGLTESIRELVNRYDEEFEIFFTIDIINIDSYFNQEQALNIYRFTQEALNNSIKYAQARAITIQIIRKQKSRIELSIEDNGIGFDTEKKQSENTLGLKTLKERVSILKGTFEIRSVKGKGTLICASIPTRNE